MTSASAGAGARVLLPTPASARVVVVSPRPAPVPAPERRCALASSPSFTLCLSVSLSLCLSVSLSLCVRAWWWCGGVVWGEDARVCACVRACAVATGECGRRLAMLSCRRDLAHSVRLGACQPGLGHAEPCRPRTCSWQVTCTAQACTRSTGGPAVARAVFLLHAAQEGWMVHGLQTAFILCKAMQHGAGKMGAVRQC